MMHDNLKDFNLLIICGFIVIYVTILVAWITLGLNIKSLQKEVHIIGYYSDVKCPEGYHPIMVYDPRIQGTELIWKVQQPTWECVL